jgi:membrane associated rhomboid family serine protease
MKIPPGRMTNILAGLTFASFLLLLLTGQLDRASVAGGFVAARVTGAAVLLPDIWGVPIWLTPLTATLIHANWLHIGFNMLILVYCGRFVEQVIGPWLLLLLYVVGAYAAAAVQFAFDPGSLVPMVGASGAISAIFAIYALLYAKRDVHAIGPIPAGLVRVVWLALGWTALNLLVGFVSFDGGTGLRSMLSRIAIGAHIGGFIAGLLLTRPILHWRFRKKPASVN